jgi:hypothetical protein
MEVITKYPVFVDPTTEQKNQFRFSANTKELEGRMQVVNAGDFTIKGATPVFEGDKQISRNDFLYRDQITDSDSVLTPMDEYLYSERNFSEGSMDFDEFKNYGDVFSDASGKRQERRMSRQQARKAARAKANETTPGNGEPTAAEQDAKAKEGKFWNVLKGGWDNFTKSPSGQIIVDSATNYISNKLGGNSFSQPGGDISAAPVDPTKDASAPMSRTTKLVLIGGGVLLVGVILYNVLKKK